VKLLDLFNPSIKKCLFISFDKQKELIEKELSNTTFCDWEDLSINNGEIRIKDKPLSYFNFIFLGTTGSNATKASLVREYIKKSGVSHLYYGAPFYIENKLLQSFLFTQSGISQPKTIISNIANITADKLVSELKLPIISKITDGSQGRGISKLDSKAAVIRFLKANPKKEFIFQEFIPNECDYRSFFFKGELVYTIKRQRKDSKREFRNNTSLGADSSFVTLDPSIEMMARKIAVCIDLDFAGVDLMQSSDDGRWFVLETNSAPQFSKKEHLVIPKIVQYIQSC
jgi:glutathione synthase/RimK-type ligase-like ATP-grasp enzyme